MLAELHCHTSYSKASKVKVEGIDSVNDCIDFAIKKGLDALAITDHDEVQGAIAGMKYARKEKKDILIIPGIEISTNEGHLLALGVEEKIKPGLLVEETLEIVKSHGGVTIAPHPFDIQNEGIKAKAKLCNAIEAFNAFNMDRISNFVAKSFAEKYGLVTTVGSDAHCKEMIGHCVNRIDADASIDSVLNAIKKGKIEAYAKNYISINIMQQWIITRLKESEKDVEKYMDLHYKKPKRYVGKKMLNLVHRSPGKIDYFFEFLIYAGLSLSVPYSAIINLPKIRYLF